MSKLLIIRFSAMGDVAMTVPVVYSLANQYPDLDITVLSRRKFQCFFDKLLPNIHFYCADLEGKHHGMIGLHKLFYELKALNFDYVADFHYVLRTIPFDIRFRLMGIPVAYIDKGREGKKALTRRENKLKVQQNTSFVRYANVLSCLGFPVNTDFNSIYGDTKGDASLFSSLYQPKKCGEKWIGVAPFAKHKGKVYPLERMEKVVCYLSKIPNVHIFLFGNGAEEENVMLQWQKSYQQVLITYKHVDLSGELSLMSYLDVLVSMDSANMHMASMVGTPVISVWGATHPYAGFMGWKQKEENIVQVDLPCRPCSVFGNKPCYRGDYACMNNIAPEMIIDKIKKIIY